MCSRHWRFAWWHNVCTSGHALLRGMVQVDAASASVQRRSLLASIGGAIVALSGRRRFAAWAANTSGVKAEPTAVTAAAQTPPGDIKTVTAARSHAALICDAYSAGDAAVLSTMHVAPAVTIGCRHMPIRCGSKQQDSQCQWPCAVHDTAAMPRCSMSTVLHAGASVVGATGATGSRVVKQLSRAGLGGPCWDAGRRQSGGVWCSRSGEGRCAGPQASCEHAPPICCADNRDDTGTDDGLLWSVVSSLEEAMRGVDAVIITTGYKGSLFDTGGFKQVDQIGAPH